MDKIVAHESGFEALVDQDGQHRVLALLPPRPMAIPSLSSVVELIDERDWYPTNRLSYLGDIIPRYDQGSIGQCELTSEVECITGLRAIAQQETVAFSMAFPYTLLNDGQDVGASIGAGFGALRDYGVCKLSTFPANHLYRRSQIPQAAFDEARKYRALKAYHCQTFEEAVTAHLMGCWLVTPVCVGSRFSSLSAEGVYPVTPGMPNHAVSMWDLVKLKSGQWGFLNCNHWTTKWGMNGNFITSRDCYEALKYQDIIAYQAVTVDETSDFPPVAAD